LSQHEYNNEIRDFFRDIDFQGVPENDADFYLGGQEIDSFGYYNNIFLVVDAKTSTEQSTRGENVLASLQRFNGYKDGVIRELESIYSNIAEKKFFFIFWTKDKTIEPNHITTARGSNIVLRDYFDLIYYKNAYKILNNKMLVRNSFLKDIEKQLSNQIIFIDTGGYNAKSIEIRRYNKKIYNFQIPVEKLLKYSYIFRLENNTYLESYQRLLDPKKLQKLKTYITNGGYFANNILVATDEELHFTDFEGGRRSGIKIGTLEMPDLPCYLEIIDGQHRLMAYSDLERNQSDLLNVTAITDMNKVERAKLFVTVNKEQTKVKSDLLWDLTTLIEPNELPSRISKFVQNLNKNRPLKYLIKLPRQRYTKAYLSFTNLCISIGSRTRLYERYGDNEFLNKVVNSYFKVIKEEFRDDWDRCTLRNGRKGFIVTNNAISIHIRLLYRLLNRTTDAERIYLISDQREWIDHLHTYLVPSWRRYLSSNISTINVDDPYGLLRKQLTNEGARANAARQIYESIEFPS